MSALKRGSEQSTPSILPNQLFPTFAALGERNVGDHLGVLPAHGNTSPLPFCLVLLFFHTHQDWTLYFCQDLTYLAAQWLKGESQAKG